MLAPNILDQLDNWGNYTSFCHSRLGPAKIEKSFPKKKIGPKNGLFQKIVKGCLFSKNPRNPPKLG